MTGANWALRIMSWPSPSWPLKPLPVVAAEPDDSSTIEWRTPQATCSQRTFWRRSDGTSFKWSKWPMLPPRLSPRDPSWESPLLPQVSTDPRRERNSAQSASMRSLPPTDMDTIRLSSGFMSSLLDSTMRLGGGGLGV